MRHCTQCGASTPDDARFCPGCGAAVAATGTGDSLLGKVIADRYLLIEKIGQGGSGTIYRGEHTTLRKRVAVKILHAQLSSDDTALERFRRVATTVAELDNDHILQVLDFGRTEDNRLFFAMEYLEGETLTKVLERDKQLSIPRAIDVLTQIAEALMEAHGLGYVHRDLRPRNVFLINRRGRTDFVKLLDFGLAKLVLPNVEAKQTAMGMTFGDPRYMSPEQARGEALDRRSDIYSLGAIAYEVLTGAPPYTGSGTFEILQQHLDAPVPRVRDSRPDCPEWLDAAVQRALAKKPEGRFATVLKLLESLRAQQPPAPADATEKAAHAKLSAERPPSSAPAVATPVVPSMGPPTRPQAAAVEQLPPSSPRQTLAMTTLGQHAGTADKRSKQDKKSKGEKAAPEKVEVKPLTPAPATSAAGSVEVNKTPVRAADAANVPSVVVESSSQDKTVPSKMARGAPAPPLPPAPTPAPAAEPARKKGDPTGEWFSSDSQPLRTIPGAASYDEFDELPRKNRGPVIIGIVAGGLTLVGIVVIALLPKPQHKPLHGEKPAAQAATASQVKPAQPSGTAIQPSGAAAQGSITASGATAQPGQPAVAAASGTTTAAQPSGAPAPTATPPAVAAKPATPADKAPTKPATPAVKQTPKPALANATPPPPAKPEKPIQLAAADKPSTHEPPAEKPAPSERHRHEKVPPGFKDPFAADAPKPSAHSGESAQAEFFIKLGRQKLNASELAAAASNFNKAREYDARSPDAIAGLGEVAFEQGDYAGAAVHLKQALRLAPKKSRYLILLGQTYYNLGRAREAVSEYKRALRLDPNNREAQHSLEVAERKLQSGG
jgi:serine/threonine-protein kinase